MKSACNVRSLSFAVRPEDEEELEEELEELELEEEEEETEESDEEEEGASLIKSRGGRWLIVHATIDGSSA